MRVVIGQIIRKGFPRRLVLQCTRSSSGRTGNVEDVEGQRQDKG